MTLTEVLNSTKKAYQTDKKSGYMQYCLQSDNFSYEQYCEKMERILEGKDLRGGTKNGGRPSTGRTRTKTLSLKFSEEELCKLQKAREKSGLSMTDFIVSMLEG